MWPSRITTILIPSMSIFKMIYTLFLVQITQVFCVDTISTLKDTFGYNFTVAPRVGTVLIWKISGNDEPFAPLKFKKNDIQFGSEETYLLLAKKSLGRFTTYYWSGRNTSLTDKQVVAKYAVILTQFAKAPSSSYQHHWINIARETEGMESDSFQFTMKMFKRQASHQKAFDFFTDYLNLHFPSPRPSLYVVQGERSSRIKKIPTSLGLLWLTNEYSCLLLEIEYKVEGMLPINYFCGRKANKKQIERSMKFAGNFVGYLDARWFTYEVENDKSLADYKKFLEVLEDCRFYNQNEVDDSEDHVKNIEEFVISRDETLLLFDICTDGLRVNHTRPINSSIFLRDGTGYLMDTKSVAGVFLIFGDSENVENRVNAIQLAEEYLDETYPLSSGRIVRMRTVNTSPDSPLLDFEINLSEFPFLIRGLPRNEPW